jgi:hypothetical protein
MDKPKKVSGMVKVQSDYPHFGDAIELWGVGFKWDGKQYIAELPEADAKLMVEAGRVKLV